MIILIRSNDANPDPRLQKYINYLIKTKQEYKVIAWNRSGTSIGKKNYIYFNKRAKYGLGVKNIPKKIYWFLFIIKQLFKNRKEYQIIHACDLDTAIPSFIIKNLLKKKIIFDVFDWISTENNKSLFGNFISKIENYIFANSDYTIICEESRINQVKLDSRRYSLVLPNIPDIDIVVDNSIQKEINEQRKKFKMIFSYVGVFDRNRGIEDILKIVSKNDAICLNIAGFGFLESEVNHFSKQYTNIKYWGKVDYNIGLNIMKESDIILAFYYLTNPVHKYAAPNKYYEGLFLGKAILTNRGTLLSEKIINENTGYVIDEGESSIEKFITDFYLGNDYIEKNRNSCNLWKEKYGDYTKEFMNKAYSKLIK